MRLGKKATKMYKENKNVGVKPITNSTAMLVHAIEDDYIIWSMSFSEYCYKSKLIYTKDERIIFRGWGMTHDINEFERIYSL